MFFRSSPSHFAAQKRTIFGENMDLLLQFLKNKQQALGLNQFNVNGSVVQTVTVCAREAP